MVCAHRGAPSTPARKHGASPRSVQGPALHALGRRCATIGTCCFGSRSGRQGSRSAPSRLRSRANSRRSRSPARRSRAPWPFSAPAGRCSPAASCSGAGGRGTPSARSSSLRAAPGFLPSGTTPASARPQPSRSAWSSSRRVRRLQRGRCSPTRAAASASRVERVAVIAALASAVLAMGLLPALFYDPATFGCMRCPDNLLLVSDDPGLVDDLNALGVRLGLAYVPLADRRGHVESCALEQDETASCRARRPRRLRIPRARGGLVRGELRARFRGERRARAPAVARPGRCARGPRGRCRLGAVSGSPHALVPRPAGGRAGRVGLRPAACGTGSPRLWATRSSRSPTR